MLTPISKLRCRFWDSWKVRKLHKNFRNKNWLILKILVGQRENNVDREENWGEKRGERRGENWEENNK